MSLCTVDPTSLLLSLQNGEMQCNDVTICYLSVFISHAFAKVFVLRRQKKQFHWSVLASPKSRGPICCVTAKDTRGAALFLGDDQPIEMSDDLTAFSFKSMR